MIYSIIKFSYECGVCVLFIKYGIGENSKFFFVLKKSYVNYWLRELDEVIVYYMV